MATVIITASILFTEEESREFVKRIGDAAVKAFRLPKDLRDVYLYPIPEYAQTPHECGQMTCFVYTAPGKPVEYKRDMVQGIQETTQQFFGEKEVNTVVIIKEHPDENVGAGGTLRLDAKKNG